MGDPAPGVRIGRFTSNCEDQMRAIVVRGRTTDAEGVVELPCEPCSYRIEVTPRAGRRRVPHDLGPGRTARRRGLAERSRSESPPSSAVIAPAACALRRSHSTRPTRRPRSRLSRRPSRRPRPRPRPRTKSRYRGRPWSPIASPAGDEAETPPVCWISNASSRSRFPSVSSRSRPVVHVGPLTIRHLAEPRGPELHAICLDESGY